MAQKKKFYSVAVGRKTGIFETWSEAEAQVKGFAGAKFKGFPARAEAQNWLNNPVYADNKKKPKKKNKTVNHEVDYPDGALIIYTDGGAINNPGPGGYGAVILDDSQKVELTGGFCMTTNNRMELTACIVALEKMEHERRPIVLYSDSKYVVNGITKGWAAGWRKRGWKKADGNEAVNKDLWARLLNCIVSLDVTFNWVKGHSGNPLNERCDQLAVAAARGTDLPVDEGYEVCGKIRSCP